ncbi:MAG: hypothetical protein V3V00_13115 [Saprospiraceae bacterium]
MNIEGINNIRMYGIVRNNKDKSANPNSKIEEEGMSHKNKLSIKIKRPMDTILKGDFKKFDND